MTLKRETLYLGKSVDPLKSKLVYLVGTLIALLYNGMSAFQYCEVTFGDINYSILESLYVVMVTLSTVGYGGKLSFILLIFFGYTNTIYRHHPTY